MVVSIVLPCYHPAPGWEQNVCSAYEAFCREVQTTVELIIVMDGDSPTVTETTLQYLQKNITPIQIVRYAGNRGKGYAIRKGVEASKGENIIYTDIDFPYTA